MRRGQRPKLAIELSSEERQVLEALSRKRTALHCEVQRACVGMVLGWLMALPLTPRMPLFETPLLLGLPALGTVTGALLSYRLRYRRYPVTEGFYAPACGLPAASSSSSSA